MGGPDPRLPFSAYRDGERKCLGWQDRGPASQRGSRHVRGHRQPVRQVTSCFLNKQLGFRKVGTNECWSIRGRLARLVCFFIARGLCLQLPALAEGPRAICIYKII